MDFIEAVADKMLRAVLIGGVFVIFLWIIGVVK